MISEVTASSNVLILDKTQRRQETEKAERDRGILQRRNEWG